MVGVLGMLGFAQRGPWLGVMVGVGFMGLGKVSDILFSR